MVSRQILDSNPDHPSGLLSLARTLLAQGDPAGALPILRNFPVSKEYAAAEQLIPLAQAMADMQNNEFEQDDLAPLYANVLRLAGRGQLPQALDGLLELLRENKKYRRGEARKVAIGLMTVMGEENPQTREYRNELASLLF